MNAGVAEGQMLEDHVVAGSGQLAMHAQRRLDMAVFEAGITVAIKDQLVRVGAFNVRAEAAVPPVAIL